MTGHIRRVLERLQIECLVVLGDNRALQYAAALSSQGVPVIGIPKSVHNDVNGSHYCLGFSTALARGVQFVHEVRAMAGSREEVAVVEVLGRSSGLTTMLISVLSGADRTLIPEVPFDPELLASLLMQDKRINPNNYAILAMSQGAKVAPDKAMQYAPALSRLAQSSLLAQVTAAKAQETGVDTGGYTLAGATEMGTEVSGAGPAVTEILEHLLGQRLDLPATVVSDSHRTARRTGPVGSGEFRHIGDESAEQRQTWAAWLPIGAATTTWTCRWRP